MSTGTAGALIWWRGRTVQLVARAVLIGLLVVPVALNLPGVIRSAQAAPLEDCDADGFDDATGVAVPWPGFDETHGDTPAGPGTAQWWIDQNAAAAGKNSGSGGGGTSGTGTSSSPDSGSGSSGGSGSGSTGSGSSSGSGSGSASSSGNSKKAASSGGTVVSPAAAVTAAQPAAASAAAVTSAASSQLATGSVSATTGASAESRAASGTAAGATTGAGGPSGGQTRFWEALTVGFTSQNTGFLAGLSLLAALALAGGLALGISALQRVGRPTRTRSAVVEHSEGQPASAT